MTTTCRDSRPHTLVALPPVDPSAYLSFKPGRFDKIVLKEDGDSSPSADFRYQLLIVDRHDIANITKQSILYPCAVFLIPQGREADYTFSKYQGLYGVAQSAACARLIAVAFHRNHLYETQDLVQMELEFIVQVIAQQGSFLSHITPLPKQPHTIPFMAMNGLGKRNVIVEGESDRTGKYIVEEVEMDAYGDDTVRVARRLFFLQNDNVIQTQVFMIKTPRTDQPPILDVESLAFDYHCNMAMGLVTLGHEQALFGTGSNTLPRGIIVGLGGGGLVNFLHLFFTHITWTVLELDPNIVEIAKLYFGFKQDPQRLHVQVQDGLSIQLYDNNYQCDDITSNSNIIVHPSSIAFFIIDVDAKDVTVGMSCPPVEFVSIDYLNRIYQSLDEGGVLALNISARDPDMLQMVLDRVQNVFQSNIFISNPKMDEKSDARIDNEQGDELNTVVFCKKCSLHEKYKLQSAKELRKRLTQLCAMNQLEDSSHMSEWKDSVVNIESWTGAIIKKTMDETLDKMQGLQVGQPSVNRKKDSKGKKKKR